MLPILLIAITIPIIGTHLPIFLYKLMQHYNVENVFPLVLVITSTLLLSLLYKIVIWIEQIMIHQHYTNNNNGRQQQQQLFNHSKNQIQVLPYPKYTNNNKTLLRAEAEDDDDDPYPRKRTLSSLLTSTQTTTTTTSTTTTLPSHFIITPDSDNHLYNEVIQLLTPQERNSLTHDVRARYLRGSSFIHNRHKRFKYLHKKLIAHSQWRLRMNPTTLTSPVRRKVEYPTEILIQFRNEAWPIMMYGNDYEGNPIIGLKLVDVQFDHVKDALYFSQFLDYMALSQQTLMELVTVKQTCIPAEIIKQYPMEYVQIKYNFILDLKGMSLSEWKSAWNLGFTQLAHLWGTNYADTLKRLYILHPPRALSLAMSAISPFIEPDTKLKIQIVPNVDSFIAAATERDHILKNAIPKWAGGECDGEWVVM
jgi:hypothetical protein